MKLLLQLSRAIDTLNEWVGRITMWLVIPMVGIGAYNAIVRSLDRVTGSNLASNTYFELQWYIFSLIFLLMVGYVLKHDRHVRVDVIYGRLSERGKAWVNLLGSLLFLLPVALILVYVSYPVVANSVAVREVSSDAGGLPRWPLKVVLLPAFTLLALQAFSEFIKNLAFLRGHISAPTHEPLGEVA